MYFSEVYFTNKNHVLKEFSEDYIVYNGCNDFTNPGRSSADQPNDDQSSFL